MKLSIQIFVCLFFALSTRRLPSVTASENSLRGGSSSPSGWRRIDQQHPCHNFPNWRDDRDWRYDCNWYEESPEGRCDDFGSINAGVGGLTANEACCVCGGGFAFTSGPTRITSKRTDPTDGSSTTLCMTIDIDTDESTPASESNVVMDVCDGRASQDWIVEEPSEGSAFTRRKVFIIKSYMDPTFCLDADRRGSKMVTNLYVYGCKGPNRSDRRFNQEFDLGYFCETNKLLNKSEYCLDWDETDSMNIIGEYKAGGGPCCPDHSPEFKFV